MQEDSRKSLDQMRLLFPLPRFSGSAPHLPSPDFSAKRIGKADKKRKWGRNVSKKITQFSVSKQFLLPLVFCIGFWMSPFASLRAQVLPGEDIKKIQTLNEAISETESLLAKYPQSEFVPNLMFQLVELYVKRSSLNFQREMLLYEVAEQKFEQKQIANEPVPPKINYRDALDTAYKLLEKFPAAPFREKLLYRIALCHLEEGNQEKAAEYLQILSTETHDKQFLEESYFRLGEFYFDKKDYRKAVEYYSRLLESWDSPFFGMALYKLGWSYYNTDNYPQAISTYIYLIEDINLLEQADAEYLGKTKTDLRREAIEYIAICFAEYGGPRKAREFLTARKEKDYTVTVLEHMAEIYKQRNFYAEAIEALHVLLEFYPNKLEAPKYHQQIVENYELAGEKTRADEERVKFANQYGPKSEWMKQVPPGPARDEILAAVDDYLYTLGTDAQAKAREMKSDLYYGLAISRYRNYLDTFPKNPHSGKVQFYLAECFYEMGKLAEAAEAYFDLALHYPESEYREQAAFNRVLAYNQLLMNDGAVDSTAFFLFNFLGKSDARVEILRVLNPTQAQLLQACNDFVVYHNSSARLPEILMKYAELLFGLEEYDLARDAYLKVMDHPAAGPFLPLACTMAGQCDFKQNRFKDAEDWFLKVTREFPDSVRHVERANKLIATARFKAAETMLADGDSARAAAEFEIVATVVSDPEVAERALWESARIYEIKNGKSRAAALYEMIPKRFPESQQSDKAFFKAAFLSEELGDWKRAAENYLALYQSVPSSELASKSLFLAARNFENLNQLERARGYYGEYIRKFKEDDPDRYLEAAFRKGEIAFNQKQYETARRELEAVIRAYEQLTAKNIEAERYVPANAQFLIGEIVHLEFQKIQLAPPLERNLKRKRAKFEEVIKSYTTAAKYQVADWTTAASYKIGVTFEDFANALLESPRPANLSGAALDQYNEKLWQSVLPLKEKALSTYQNNLKQAADYGVENQWITETKKRVQALLTELGLDTAASRPPGM